MILGYADAAGAAESLANVTEPSGTGAFFVASNLGALRTATLADKLGVNFLFGDGATTTFVIDQPLPTNPRASFISCLAALNLEGIPDSWAVDLAIVFGGVTTMLGADIRRNRYGRARHALWLAPSSPLQADSVQVWVTPNPDASGYFSIGRVFPGLHLELLDNAARTDGQVDPSLVSPSRDNWSRRGTFRTQARQPTRVIEHLNLAEARAIAKVFRLVGRTDPVLVIDDESPDETVYGFMAQDPKVAQAQNGRDYLATIKVLEDPGKAASGPPPIAPPEVPPVVFAEGAEAPDGTAQTTTYTHAAWDPLKQNTAISTLSNSNRTITATGNPWQTAAANIGKTSGKWVFKLTGAATPGNVMIGLVGGVSLPWATGVGGNGYLSTIAEATHEIGWWGNGPIYYNNGGGASNYGGSSYTSSDDVRWEVDLDGLTAKAYKNSTLIQTHALAAGKTWFPACSLQNLGTATLNAGQVAITPINSGYNAGWFDSSVGGGAYSHDYSPFVSGGNGGPYTFTISAGALPTGATLNASTGVAAGTLTTPGAYSWTVAATDGLGNVGYFPDSVTVV
jgi:hypothetical protein